MPYILNDGRRETLKNGAIANCAVDIYDYANNFLGNSPNYQKYNDMTGALIRCYRELERRFNVQVKVILDVLDEFDKAIEKYENLKIKENGDTI